jgi:tRNA-specific adenosine deaminase 3
MEKFMRAAIRLSQQVYKIQDKPPYNLPIATLIVDPVTSRIVASTFDTRVSTGQPLNHSVVTAINLLAISPGRRGEDYYARGYDFYTTHEPCDMCCMAMIHSRVRRCVWWKEMRYTGGRGLGWRKELKHRYLSFQWAGDDSVGKGVVEEVPWDICA